MKLSIIIPVRNEALNIAALLASLQPFRQRGHEIIMVDAGSCDGTLAIARPLCDQCLQSERGRAVQMCAGARTASGEVLWFLHADSSVPERADEMIAQVLANAEWGGFPVCLSGRQRLLRIVERLMNARSRLSGILTGDQGIFVTRQLFDRVGGYHDIPLMEDIDLSTRLKRLRRVDRSMSSISGMS
jgi:rSAM/selenodomain-associated transferase 2